MISALISRLVILSFGTLYPAYASYKAVRTKNVKEYVKWMMYWIVYAFFTCFETFTDIFLSWFPFYYEVKVVIVLWLLSPATKGSSTLYRKFVHPMLTRREQEIDEYINQAKERGYSAVLQLGSKGVNYATNVIMQTAIKGGGNLVQTIRRSYSLSDLSEPDMHRTAEEVDDVVTLPPQQRMLRSRFPPGNRHSTGMYFTEVDVASRAAADFNYNIRSSDDISSGYSSTEPVSANLSRTSSMTNASRPRPRPKRAEGVVVYEFQQSFHPLENYCYSQDISTNQSTITLNKQEDNNFDYIIREQNLEIHQNPVLDTSSFPEKSISFIDEDDNSSDEFYEITSDKSDKEIEHDEQNEKSYFNPNAITKNYVKIENSEQFVAAERLKKTSRPYLHKKGKAPKPIMLAFDEGKTESSINEQGGAISSNLKETQI
uniref:Receptor expression-enhancing protein n=1 Tax=Glossina brevipalpis TaxID=37001 RepID=A0A1A9WW27_9MUSC